MILHIHFFLYRFRFILSGALVLAASFLILCAVAVSSPVTTQAKVSGTAPDQATASLADNPNIATESLTAAAYAITDTLEQAAAASTHGLRATGTAIARTASAIGSSTLRALTTGAKGVGTGVMFVLRAPGNAFGFVANTAAVNAVIKPADHNPVPTIDPQSPDVLAAKAALQAAQAQPATPQTDAEPVWPMHGDITTSFGEAGWAYATVHTGIDISDGKPSGTTPVKPFRPGTVITAERSGGLGNHVTIDHGSGVTSVYGHLSSISVQVGQEVKADMILGYEGSTGVSTGPHLHFEIRVNGQATDPRQFIGGEP